METFQKSSFMPWHTKQGWTSTMYTNSLSSLHLHREITNKQRRNSRITNSWIFAVQKDLNATQTFWHFPLNLRCGLGISETPGLEDTPIYRRILFPARAKCQQGQGSLPSSHTNRLQKVVGFFFSCNKFVLLICSVDSSLCTALLCLSSSHVLQRAALHNKLSLCNEIFQEMRLVLICCSHNASPTLHKIAPSTAGVYLSQGLADKFWLAQAIIANKLKMESTRELHLLGSTP